MFHRIKPIRSTLVLRSPTCSNCSEMPRWTITLRQSTRLKRLPAQGSVNFDFLVHFPHRRLQSLSLMSLPCCFHPPAVQTPSHPYGDHWGLPLLPKKECRSASYTLRHPRLLIDPGFQLYKRCVGTLSFLTALPLTPLTYGFLPGSRSPTVCFPPRVHRCRKYVHSP